jgi:putative thiamine transport system permease protein
MEALGTPRTHGLVIFGHLLFVLPYVFLSLVEAYRRLDPRWARLALSLGASPERTFWRRAPADAAGAAADRHGGGPRGQHRPVPADPAAGRRPGAHRDHRGGLPGRGGNRRVIGVWALVQASLPLVGFVIAVGLPRLLWSNRRGMREPHADEQTLILEGIRIAAGRAGRW